MVVLPFGLGDRGGTQALARPPDLVGVGGLEAEVVRARQVARHGPFAKREHRAVARAEDQQVLVVVHALRQPKVRAVEGRGPLAIADGQSDVVEGHGAMMAWSERRS